jgi:hypothetical protein
MHGQAGRGARLFGAVNELVQKIFGGRSLTDKFDSQEYERGLSAAHAQLGEIAFAAVFAEGQQMTLDEAVAYALADTTPVETANEF